MPETFKHTLEVVEDSEPEREKKRQKTREKTRLTKMKKLTDTSFVATQSQRQFEQSVSELEHTDLDTSITPDRCEHQILDAQRNLATNRASTFPTPPPIATLEASLSSDSEGESRLKLSCFAFQAPVSKSKLTNLRSVDAIIAQNLPESSCAPKAKLRRHVHGFSNEFLEIHLASLTKCVSCNLKWTLTKTASQKMIHIQNCAKKKFLSDETVRTLIHKEIGPSSNRSPLERSEQTATEKCEKSTTFLETVVNEVSRTKKGRRPQVMGTVKSLPETRGSILGRARAVLDTSMQHRESVVSEKISNQNQDDPPCTQAFGASMLACRVDSYLRKQSDPPQTQDFGESALGRPQSNAKFIALHTPTSGL